MRANRSESEFEPSRPTSWCGLLILMVRLRRGLRSISLDEAVTSQVYDMGR